MAVMIPETYISDLQLRMGLYKRLADLDEDEAIEAFAAELIDRFGRLPEEVEHLLAIVRIKALCRRANVEKVDVGPKGAVVGFRENTSANPAGLLGWVQNYDPVTGSKVVYFGFPYETIISAAVRESLMFDALAFFEVIPQPLLATPVFQPGQGSVVLTWNSIPGRKYRVQVKSDLAAPIWINLGSILTATGPTESITDLTASMSSQRFYRVVMVD
jgi:hypothetical protein